MPKINEAVVDYLHLHEVSIVTPYTFFLIVSDFYRSRQWQGARIAIKGKSPKPQDLRRITSKLIKGEHLKADTDFSTILKVIKAPDVPAEEYCQIVDPFCCISHYSAMQYHELIETPSPTLSLSTLAIEHWNKAAHEKMNVDCAEYASRPEGRYALRYPKLPSNVRGREINMHRVNQAKDFIHAKETGWRIASLGETLKDMLERPNWCGGMPNVIDALEIHLNRCQEALINAVDKSDISIVKVRAGYLLEERFKIQDRRIQKWAPFAQRGGSRKLDPEKDYIEPFSEKWMISINA